MFFLKSSQFRFVSMFSCYMNFTRSNFAVFLSNHFKNVYLHFLKHSVKNVREPARKYQLWIGRQAFTVTWSDQSTMHTGSISKTCCLVIQYGIRQMTFIPQILPLFGNVKCSTPKKVDMDKKKLYSKKKWCAKEKAKV